MLFPVLETEALVQEGDKTRLSAVKSYVSGTGAITAISIAPGKLADPIAVDLGDDAFLDWAFEFLVDVDAENDGIDFQEGDTVLAATIPHESYTLAELAAEIATQMSAVSDLDYTAEVSSTGKITISSTGEFSLLPETGDNALISILPEAGFSEDTDADTEVTGEEIRTVRKKITVEVDGDGNDDTEKSVTLEVISETADRLFSDDSQLRKHEPNILDFVPAGRATFKDVHRRAQETIMAWLDTNGYTDSTGDKLTTAAIVDVAEVAEWATMVALRLIFEGISNATDDIFAVKAERYEAKEGFYRNRAVLRLDADGDGEADAGEEVPIQGARVVRR